MNSKGVLSMVPAGATQYTLRNKVTMPTSSGDPGEVGQYALDADHIAIYDAVVGWVILPRAVAGAGDLLAANNLSDVASVAAAFAILKQGATTSATGVVEIATDAEAQAGTDTSRSITPSAMAKAVAILRNALTPRGGVAFDGTASSRVFSTLTGQSIGTDPFSLSIMVQIPAVAPTAYGLIMLSPSATTVAGVASIGLALNSSGALIATLRTDDSNYNQLTVASVVANFGGKVAHVVFVRNSSGNPTVYINGVSQTVSVTSAGTPPTWQGTITSTYLGVGFESAANVLVGSVYAASLYNLALSAADVLEIYELGGAVPFRFQFGSQAADYTSDFSAGADSWFANAGSPTVTGNIDSIGAINDTLRVATGAGSASGFVAQRNTTLADRSGKAYRLTGSYYKDAGLTGLTTLRIEDSDSATSLGDTITSFVDTTWTTFALAFVSRAGAGRRNMALSFVGAGIPASQNFYLKTLKFVAIGAVVHLPLNDGIGYQLHDESTNKLDAVMTTTGVAHLLPLRRGYVRGTLTWAGTHEAKSVLGQRAFPAGAVVKTITKLPTASSSGSGSTIGSTNTAARWEALDTYTANTKERVALANNLPAGTAAADHDLLIDPDTANFTGSISVEVSYEVSEGDAAGATPAEKLVRPTVTNAAETQQTLTDGANIAWNMDSGGAAKVTLGGNRTIDNPTNTRDGSTYILELIQDGTGSRTITWGSNFVWPNGTAPTLTTTASKRDILTFFCTNTGKLLGTSVLNFA